jgi:Na+-translocating ferredoxin:NAD+ oxidoreductase RnfG subunit
MRHSWHRWLTPPALVLCAGSVYAEQYLTVAEAQALIFPGEQMSPAPVTLTATQSKAIERDSGVRVRVRGLNAWRTTSGGVFIVDQVLGKHEYITWAIGIGADGRVRGIEILDYRETYGSEVRQAKWRAQFVGKAHGAPLKLDADIKNISGATLSSRHITDGVKRLLATYEIAFGH